MEFDIAPWACRQALLTGHSICVGMPLIKTTCFLLPRSFLVQLLTCVQRQSGNSETAVFRPYNVVLQEELVSLRQCSVSLQGCDSREDLLFVLSRELPQASSAA